MKYSLVIILVSLVVLNAYAQNMTDVSLYMKGGPQVSSVMTTQDDMFYKVGHHGPAIENEWLGLRIYFDYKVAIDVYNKTKPQLELAKAEWYPTKEQQENGWGADSYKVGETVGLGGVRLWDGNKVIFLNPIKERTARVRKEAMLSYMEMLSEGIPYKNDTIDVLLRVTVYSGIREAKVEAFAFSSRPVEFVTGINYHDGTETFRRDDYIGTWGVHPEDVAAFERNIGAAIIYNPDDFSSIEKTPKEYRMITKPTKYLETHITSVCEKEAGFSSMEAFINYLKTL